ncbi:hypothetical protein FZEAL_3627 [Fusarium zealandicum]|uniref:Uncharacterized protein n=1 Tax=Fusarium zealandicum TaxID=1053134 RepID=A0A8H4UP73_9HYPO|nr:hypothetical protein FZEAL_3627 [Fusarium zealandicum]
MPPEDILRRVEGIKKLVARYSSEFASAKSPTQIYQESTEVIRQNITLIWENLARTTPSQLPSVQQTIVDLGGRLKELEIEHKAKVDEEEKAYSQKLLTTLDALYGDFLEEIGPIRVRSYLKTLPNNAPVESDAVGHLHSPTPTPRSVQQEQSVAAQVQEPKTKRIASNDTPSVAPNKRKRDLPNSTSNKRQRTEETVLHTPSITVIPEPSSPTTRPSRRATRHSHRRHGDSAGDDDFEGITTPDAGNVYMAFWEKSKEWLAVLVLPMQDLQSIGIPGSLEGLGLQDIVPSCYVHDDETGNYDWAEEYQDGQSLITEREFPVMYFDGQDFPDKSAVGWVAAKDLREFDAKSKNSLVPHIQSVRKFLKARAAKRVADETGIVMSDIAEEETGEHNPDSALSPEAERQSLQAQPPGLDQSPQNYESVIVVQPIPSSVDHGVDSSVIVPPQPRSGTDQENEQKHRPDVEIITISDSGSEVETDEDWSPDVNLSPAVPERLAHTDPELNKSRTSWPLKESEPLGLSEAFRLAHTALRGSVQPGTPDTGASLPDQWSQPLQEVSHPSHQASEPNVITQQLDEENVGHEAPQNGSFEPQTQPNFNSGPSTGNGTEWTREQWHRTSDGAHINKPSSGMASIMPQQHPILPRMQTPHSGLRPTPNTVFPLPPISSMIRQDQSPPPQGPSSQGPMEQAQFLQTSSTPAAFASQLPSSTATNQQNSLALAHLIPYSVPSPTTQLPSNKPPTPTPAIHSLPAQPLSTRHGTSISSGGQTHDSVGMAWGSPAISNALPTATTHDGPSSHTSLVDAAESHLLAGPQGSWQADLPYDLVTYLEDYQRDNNLPLGMVGLQVASKSSQYRYQYSCPFCREAQRVATVVIERGAWGELLITDGGNNIAPKASAADRGMERDAASQAEKFHLSPALPRWSSLLLENFERSPEA